MVLSSNYSFHTIKIVSFPRYNTEYPASAGLIFLSPQACPAIAGGDGGSRGQKVCVRLCKSSEPGERAVNKKHRLKQSGNLFC